MRGNYKRYSAGQHELSGIPSFKRKLKTYEYVGTFHLWQLILHFPRCPVALVQTLWRKKRLDRQILGTHVCT